MTATGGDNAVAGARACGAALCHVEVEPAVVLQQLGTLQASTFHANRGGHGPCVEDLARRSLDRQAVGCKLGHASAVHVQKTAAILADVGGVDGIDAEIDGLAPWACWLVGVNHAQAAVGGKVDVKVALVLAEVGRPHRAVIAVESGGNRKPVDQVAGVPDEQPGRVIEAGVGQIEVVSNTNRAGVRVIAAQDGIAIDVRGLRQGETGFEGVGECGAGGGVQYKTAAGQHSRASVTSKGWWSTAIVLRGPVAQWASFNPRHRKRNLVYGAQDVKLTTPATSL